MKLEVGVQGERVFRDISALIVLGLVLLLPGIGSRDLWNPDEPRYAEVAREMLEEGSFFLPRLNGRLYSQKPPLHFWSIATVGWLRGGVDEVAARLPAVLAGCASLALVYGVASLLFGRGAALVAAVVFLGTNKILWQARVGQIDMTLCALVLAAILSFVWGWKRNQPSVFLLFYLFTGLATLAKGPAGFLPPLLSIVLFLILMREGDNLRRFVRPRGFALWLAVVLLWFAPAVWLTGQDYLSTMLVEQNLDRFTRPSGHIKPFYYYLTTIPADFLPFTFLLPACSWIAWSRARAAERKSLMFLLTWFVVTVVFFSLSPGKRTVYVVATMAPLSMVVGLAMAKLDEGRRQGRGAADAELLPAQRRLLWLGLLFTTLLFLALFVAVPVAIERFPDIVQANPSIKSKGFVSLLPVGVAAVLCPLLAYLARWRQVVGCVAAGMALTMALGAVLVLPALDQTKSARALAGTLSEVALADEPYAIYPMPDEAFTFYSRRFAIATYDEAELESFLEGPGRRWLLIERDDLETLDLAKDLVEVARDRDTNEGHVLMTSRPWPRETSSGD